MNRSPLHFLFRCLAVVILLTVSACATNRSPAATVTPSPVPATDTPQPTATATATATLTPTPTLTATATATVQPSPTPQGFFNNNSAGFALTYPKRWEIINQTNNSVQLANRIAGVVLMLNSLPEPEPITMNELVDGLKAGMGSGVTMTQKGNTENVELGNVQAQRAVLVVMQDGSPLDMWLYYVHKGNRGYMIAISSHPGGLEDYNDAIDQILQSLNLYMPQSYDLPHEQTLTMLGGDPLAESLDPAVSKNSSGDMVGLLFSGLVRLDTQLKVTPDLAESWKISSDGKVYTFTLRAELKFADGSPITAETVRKSWERACDPKLKSSTAAIYLGDILGVKDKIAGKAQEIQGVKVIDERTLEVTLDGAKPYFLAKLTYPTSFVVDARDAERDAKNWMYRPNSSGPYQVKKYTAHEEMVFERNPNYPQPAGINNLVYLLNWGGSPLSLYEDGTIDIVSLSASEIQEIGKPDHPLNKQMLTAPALCTDYLQINTSAAPTDDLQVRKALFLALNRSQWVEKISGSTALAANGILPPAMPGALAGRKLPDFDVQTAKDALKQSKYAGQPITITLSASGYADSQRQDVAFLVDQWQKNLRVKVQVELLDPAKYTEAVRNKPGNIIIGGWCADYPDPENFLDVLFHSGGSFNSANLSDPEVDALLEKARIELDPAKRIRLYQQAEDRLLEQFDVFPLNNGSLGMVIKPRIKNYVLTPSDIKIIPLLTIEEP